MLMPRKNGILETDVLSYYISNKSNMATAAMFNFFPQNEMTQTPIVVNWQNLVEILRAISGNRSVDQN